MKLPPHEISACSVVRAYADKRCALFNAWRFQNWTVVFSEWKWAREANPDR